jgi:hypothetical protein
VLHVAVKESFNRNRNRFIGIPNAFLYVLSNGNPINKYYVEKHIPAHLSEMGYSQRDIDLQGYIEPKYLINKDVYHGHYRVVFKDEPNLEYLYGKKKNGKEVVQFCEKETRIGDHSYGDMTAEKTNHSEENCLGYFENRE